MKTKTDGSQGAGRLHRVVRLPSVALTIKQPWASLIIGGGKDIENRSWPTTFRGSVLIHASKKRDNEELLSYKALRESSEIQVRWNGATPKWGDVPCGGVIGVADIVDCVSESTSPWFVGEFGFVLSNPRPLPFFECRGALGFWRCEYPDALLWEANTISECVVRVIEEDEESDDGDEEETLNGDGGTPE